MAVCFDDTFFDGAFFEVCSAVPPPPIISPPPPSGGGPAFIIPGVTITDDFLREDDEDFLAIL